MKKTLTMIIALLLVVCFCFSFVACNNGGGEQNNNNNNSTVEPGKTDPKDNDPAGKTEEAKVTTTMDAFASFANAYLMNNDGVTATALAKYLDAYKKDAAYKDIITGVSGKEGENGTIVLTVTFKDKTKKEIVFKSVAKDEGIHAGATFNVGENIGENAITADEAIGILSRRLLTRPLLSPRMTDSVSPQRPISNSTTANLPPNSLLIL